jgi:arginine:pyruvate transaminase
MRFSGLVDRIAGGGADAWEVHIEARRQRDAGRDVIFLTVGDPDQPAPAAVTDATIEALRQQHKGYSANSGLPNVRFAIAARIVRRAGMPCHADNVSVVPGAQAGLFCAIQCIAGPDDEIIVPEPVYATYEAVIGASGARMVNVPLTPARQFHPDIDAISAAITPRTRAIWINSPHNPTGAVLQASEVAAIADLCRRHDLWLLSDEVYEDLTYARPHTSAWSIPAMADRTIVVSSLSKSHAIPGYRFGWVAGPKELIHHISNLILCMLYGGPPFIQEGVLPALMEDLPEVEALRDAYRHRATRMSAILETAAGCDIVRPEGGMFLLLDVRRTGLSSKQFAQMLLEREAVAVLPCDTFGPSAVGHLRISLTASEPTLEDAGQRIVACADRLMRERASGGGAT